MTYFAKSLGWTFWFERFPRVFWWPFHRNALVCSDAPYFKYLVLCAFLRIVLFYIIYFSSSSFSYFSSIGYFSAISLLHDSPGHRPSPRHAQSRHSETKLQRRNLPHQQVQQSPFCFAFITIQHILLELMPYYKNHILYCIKSI